jgi:hypothetical protein
MLKHTVHCRHILHTDFLVSLKDLVALVVLEDRGGAEALSDAGPAERNRRAYVLLLCSFYLGILFKSR